MNLFNLTAKLSLNTKDYTKNLNNVSKNFTNVSNTVSSKANSMGKSMLNAFGKIDKASSNTYSKVTSGINNVSMAYQRTASRISESMSNSNNRIIKSTGNMSKSVLNTASNIPKAFSNAGSRMTQSIRSATSSINRQMPFLSKTFSNTASSISKSMSGAFNSIKRGFSSLTSTASNSSSRISSAFSRMGSGAGTVNGAIGSVGKSFINMKTIALGAISGVIGGFAKMAISISADTESALVSWNTLLGGQEEAVAMFEQIESFATRTPFDVKSVDQMAKYLYNAGYEGDELFDTLTKLGDTGSALSVPTDGILEMTRQFAQVKNAGVAYTEDLNILEQRSVPIMKAISETMGVATEDVKKLASEGKISFEIYEKSLNSLWSDKYAGGMDAQSKTFKGLVSTLVDGGKQLTRLAFEPVFDKMKGGLEKVVPALQNFIGLAGEKGLVPALTEMLPKAFNAMQTQLPLMIQNGILAVSNFLTGIGQALPQIIPAIFSLLGTIQQSILANMPMMIDSGIQILRGLAQGLVNSLPIMIEKGAKAMSTFLSTVKSKLPQILQAGGEIIGKLISGIIKNLPKLLVEAGKLMLQLVDTLISSLPSIFNVGVEIVKGIWNGITSMGSWLWGKIKNFVSENITGPIIDFFKIGSPSKLMAETVGKPIVQGIEVGINDEVPNLDLEDITKQINTDFKSRISSTASKSPTTVINQTINSKAVLSPFEIARETKKAQERMRWGLL